MAHHHPNHDEEKLRSQGQRLTPQRRLVLEIMRGSHGHLTVDDVVNAAALQDHDVSVASVYRILAWLTDHEIVCITDVGGRDLTYEYLGNTRHHHLICQQCGTETEIPFNIIDPTIANIRTQFGFEPRIDHQAIFGTCRNCQDVNSREGIRAT